MKQILLKTNERGVTHVLLMLLLVVVVGVFGTYKIVSSSALSNTRPRATRPHFVYYSQDNVHWANRKYPYKAGGAGTIGDTGCGPTSLAMVAATLHRNRHISPPVIAARYGTRFHVDTGTEMAIYGRFAKDYHLYQINLGTNLAASAHFLQNPEALVVANVGPGIFTTEGHVVVIRAYGRGKFLIADPKHRNNNRYFTAADMAHRGNILRLTGFSD